MNFQSLHYNYNQYLDLENLRKCRFPFYLFYPHGGVIKLKEIFYRIKNIGKNTEKEDYKTKRRAKNTNYQPRNANAVKIAEKPA